jgi:hypothetical protein
VPAAGGPPPAPDVLRGPVFAGTIRGQRAEEPVAMRGLVVTLGQEEKAYVCYDMDLMRLSLGWTGSMLEFGNTQSQIQWPPPPKVKGTPVFEAMLGPGWARAGDFTDPRPNQQGPLPRDWAKYRGYHQHGTQVVLHYTVGNSDVWEMPGYEAGTFTRSFLLGPDPGPRTLSICRAGGGSESGTVGASTYMVTGKENRVAVGLIGGNPQFKFIAGDDLRLSIPPTKSPVAFQLALRSVGTNAGVEPLKAFLKVHPVAPELKPLLRGGPALWPLPVAVKGTVGTNHAAYVVDTLPEPLPNPWNAKTFFGGFDFLPDGRAVICAFHGDVWIVSGIDARLDKLEWRRFATGLFQPLGVKVVRDQIYVLGRDQITRLHDLNRDGEADYYENFNNDCILTSNYHEFSLDLQTDSKGNFYFAKGAPWEPNVTSPHQGTMIRVSKDGSRFDVIATGLRAPNGSGMGPHDELTVSDNQGHWMPSSKLNLVKPGGFYGMVPAAQRPLTFTKDGREFQANPSDPKVRSELKQKFWDAPSPLPTGYDKPIGWLPQGMDNSSGGQVWATSRKWGPLQDHLLFTSYGKCTLFNVMLEEIQGVTQAAMVQLPLKFPSGVMRGRVNPKDGQVYLCGLRGWQNAATRDGGFYRVRYTGAPLTIPVNLNTHANGVELAFANVLNVAEAIDVENYAAEMWNYRYSGGYGSPEISVNDPKKNGHDKLEVKAARIAADGKRVFLEIPGLQPCDQLRLRLKLSTADGTPIQTDVYQTILAMKPARR